MNSSTISTIGTALNRAQGNSVPVEILVEAMWIRGQVVAVDGLGVVLQTEEDRHSVIHVESIAAVTICSDAPHRRPAAPERGQTTAERVQVMPAGRTYG